MRLWHIDLIPYLPKSQLVAQKRECDLILKNWKNGKDTNHILINYIYNYEKYEFVIYYSKLQAEFKKRNFNFNDKYNVAKEKWGSKYYLSCYLGDHNNEYLTICYWNLREKYIRGQKDFTKEIWEKLDKFYKEKRK